MTMKKCWSKHSPFIAVERERRSVSSDSRDFWNFCWFNETESESCQLLTIHTSKWRIHPSCVTQNNEKISHSIFTT